MFKLESSFLAVSGFFKILLRLTVHGLGGSSSSFGAKLTLFKFGSTFSLPIDMELFNFLDVLMLLIFCFSIWVLGLYSWINLVPQLIFLFRFKKFWSGPELIGYKLLRLLTDLFSWSEESLNETLELAGSDFRPLLIYRFELYLYWWGASFLVAFSKNLEKEDFRGSEMLCKSEAPTSEFFPNLAVYRYFGIDIL